jgi:hypothetical protein
VPAGHLFTGPGISPAAGIEVNFPQMNVGWNWDPADQLWLRSQNGTSDLDRSGARLSATNVVVQFVPYISSGEETGEGVAPVPIPEGLLVGNGSAWYLSGGRLLTGSWTRSGLTSVTVFKDAAGHPVRLMPGRTWVELVPVGVQPTLVP